MLCNAYRKSPRKQLEYETFESISEIPVDQWQSVIPADNIFAQPAYLNIIENYLDGDIKPYYVLIYENETPRYACYFQIVQFKGSQLSNYIQFDQSGLFGLWKPLKPLLTGATKLFLQTINWRLLIAGNIFVTGDKGIISSSPFTTTEHQSLLDAIQYIISRETSSGSEIDACLIKDCYHSDIKTDKPLLQKGYHRFQIEPDMIMYIKQDWNDFKDYLQSLRSKYRVRARKVFKLSKSISDEDLSLDSIAENAGNIHQLYLNVASRAKFNLAYLPVEYFIELKRHFGPQFILKGYYLNDNGKMKKKKLAGFICYFISGKTLEVHFTGMDYAVNDRMKLYQRMLYDSVKLSIKLNLKKIHFGRTATEIKSSVGAIPMDMWSYIKRFNAPANILIKPLFKIVKPGKKIYRHPFK